MGYDSKTIAEMLGVDAIKLELLKVRAAIFFTKFSNAKQFHEHIGEKHIMIQKKDGNFALKIIED